jgi:hypothetical protein
MLLLSNVYKRNITKADWLAFVRRDHEFPGLNLGQRLAKATDGYCV